MTDDLRAHALDAVRNFQARTAAIRATVQAQESGLVLPSAGLGARQAREFASMMDAETARLMKAFPEFGPAEWEVFIDLLPNVRKLLGL